MTARALVLVPAEQGDRLDRLRAALCQEMLGGSYTPALEEVGLWGRPCAVDGCRVDCVTGAQVGLCRKHRYQWIASDRPDPTAFAASPSSFYTAGRSRRLKESRFVFDGLSEPLASELRLLVQTRRDQAAAVLRTVDFAMLRRIALEAGMRSLFDHLDDPPEEPVKYRNPGLLPPAFRTGHNRVRSHVAFAMATAASVYWPKDLLDRDYWLPADLGVVSHGRIRSVSFTGFKLPWVRTWVKRWAKYRLETNWKWTTAGSYLPRLLYLDRFLGEEHPGVTSQSELTRSVLLDFVAWVNRMPHEATNRQGIISTLCVMLEDHRLNEWRPALPVTAVIRRGEMPTRKQMLPRPIDDFVVAQITDPAKLATMPLWLGHWIVIMFEHGLRSADLATLEIDCLGRDADGQPTLRWFNNKRNRERLHPIREPGVVKAIEAQQRWARAQWPATTWLFPKLTGNVSGERPMVYSTVELALRRWMTATGVVTRDGSAARVTLHQFRHTFGTRELNNGVPHHVVQQLLDHDSPEMTSGYARLTNKTLRTEFVKAARFNLDGDLIPALPDDPTADAAWMKEQLNRSKVTLPNGFCTLPLQQSCDAQNACLDCQPFFRTTIDFLPIHRRQAADTRVLVERAEHDGQQRILEKNQQVLTKLETLIGSLEDHERKLARGQH